MPASSTLSLFVLFSTNACMIGVPFFFIFFFLYGLLYLVDQKRKEKKRVLEIKKISFFLFFLLM